VIVAVGQSPDVRFLDGSVISLCSEGGIMVDHETGQTAAPGVYAGGDVAGAGPESIIAACADGRRAAEAICRQFGIAFEQPAARMPVLSDADILRVKQVRARKQPQFQPGCLPVEQRASFDLIELTLTENEARREAARCVQCTTFCDKCVEVCPNRANYTFTMQPVAWNLPRLVCRDGKLAVAGTEPFRVAQTRQILHVDDWCNECDDCRTFCVHHGMPYRDKPRLFLDEEGFRLEQDNAFRIEGPAIRRREGGRDSRLARVNDHMIYENDRVRVTLTAEFGIQEMALKEAFEGTLSLRDAAEMTVVLRGVAESLPFLAI
jgi:putative selenate reductase